MTRAARRRWRVGAFCASLAGAALLVWSVRSAGVAAVRDGIERLGIGFAAICLLGGGRYALRTAAWRLCLAPGTELRYSTAFAAFVAGDALGNVTPLGALISEPAKVALVRERVALDAAIPALALENLFYGATVVVLLIAGTAALLLTVPVPPPVRAASLAVVAVALVTAALVATALVRRSPLISRGAARVGIDGDAVARMEERVFAFAARHRARIAPLLALEAAYHALAVFEIWLAMALIRGVPPSLITAFVLEYVNRTITIVFQFVPLWLGVDEAGTAAIAAALGIPPAVGVALALARKGRILAWTAAGLALLIVRPSAGAAAARPARRRGTAISEMP